MLKLVNRSSKLCSLTERLDSLHRFLGRLPLHLASKKANNWHTCVDYLMLNTKNISDIRINTSVIWYTIFSAAKLSAPLTCWGRTIRYLPIQQTFWWPWLLFHSVCTNFLLWPSDSRMRPDLPEASRWSHPSFRLCHCLCEWNFSLFPG